MVKVFLSFLNMALMYKKLPTGGAVYMSLCKVSLRRIHNLGNLTGVQLQPSAVWAQIGQAKRVRFKGPKQVRAAAEPPSNRLRYGYSRLEVTLYRDILTTPPINSYSTLPMTLWIWTKTEAYSTLKPRLAYIPLSFGSL